MLSALAQPTPPMTSAIGVRAEKKPAVGSILVVSTQVPADDNLTRSLKRAGYQVEEIPCDGDTLARIADARSKVGVVILDRRGVQGIDNTILKGLGSDPRIVDIPVLLLVGSQDDEQIRAALDADVSHHLRAPFPLSLLDASLRALCRQRERSEHRRPSEEKPILPMVETCKFRFRSPAEAKQLTPLLAAFFPDRQRAMLGINELIGNAIEHGNLEIGRDLKTRLSKTGGLQQEIYTRLHKPEFADRFVEVVIARKEEGIMLMVNDEGRGFNWKEHLEVDPALANRDHGRGIARARHMAFDKLTYNKAGNQAVALMTGTAAIQW